MTKKSFFKNGFTLVELLVVVSIIVILTAVISISFNKAQMDGRNSRRKEDIKMIHNAAEEYFMLNTAYPVTTDVAWTGPGSQLVMSKFPVDPKATSGSVYVYTSTSGGYCVCAQLENSNSGNSTNSSCDFIGSTANDSDWFCAQNQQ